MILLAFNEDKFIFRNITDKKRRMYIRIYLYMYSNLNLENKSFKSCFFKCKCRRNCGNTNADYKVTRFFFNVYYGARKPVVLDYKKNKQKTG